MQRVGLADSPLPTTPSGFTVAFKPRSDTSQGGPQPMMNCDNGSQDKLTLVWLLPDDWVRLWEQGLAVSIQRTPPLTIIAPGPHWAGSDFRLMPLCPSCLLPFSFKLFFSINLSHSSLPLSVCFPESPPNTVGTRSSPRKQEDGVWTLDHSPPG